jgi:hypothetical protein
MPTAQYWPEASAILTTLFLSVTMQSHWSPRLRRIIALGFAIGVAGVGLYVDGNVNTNDILSSLFMVVVGSQGIYTLLCKQLDGLSKATDVTDPPPNPGLGGVRIFRKDGSTYIVPDKQG